MNKISPKRTRAYAATTLAVLLATAACGGEDTADPPATSAAVQNTTPATVLPPATSPAPTTAPAPNTEPPTTTAPTPSTTTALSEEEQAKQAVIAAAENAWYLFNEAKLDPTNDAKVAAALATHSGAAANEVAEILDRYSATNQRSVTLPTAPASVVIYGDSVAVDMAARTATVEACELASNTLVIAADGVDELVNDEVASYYERETFVLENGAWLRTDVEQLQRFAGAFSCDRS